MAQGTITVFNEAKQNIANGLINLSTTTDFSCMLITTIPTAADVTPDSTDYTEVTGTGYAAGGIALTTSWTESGGTVSFDSSVNPAWSQDAAGPTGIKGALIYSESAAGEDALCFVDMTTDAGTTPLSLIAGDVTLTFTGSNLFTLA